MRSRCGVRFETCRPGIATEPRWLTASQSRLADIFTTSAVTRRIAALDVCVASSARGDEAQAALDRTLSHCRNEIGQLRQQGIQCRLLVWTAHVRPHPAVTRTLQYAADIASSRNGQHISAKSLQRRWKHEIQIAKNGSSLVSSTEPSITGDTSPLLTVDPAITTMPTPRLTQQHQTTTSPLSPVVRSSLCSRQVPNQLCLPLHHLKRFVSGLRCFFRVTSQMSLSPAALCHPSTLRSKTSSKITRCHGRFLAKCLRWSWKPIGTAFQRNRLSQRCRGTIGASALPFCGILPLQPTYLAVRSSPSNFWTWLTGGGQREQTPTLTSTISTPSQPQSTFTSSCIPRGIQVRPHSSSKTLCSQTAAGPTFSQLSPLSSPGASLTTLHYCTQPGLSEECRILSLAHPHRRLGFKSSRSAPLWCQQCQQRILQSPRSLLERVPSGVLAWRPGH